MPGMVEAASELESIARHLRQAGEFELVRELTAGMRGAVDGVPDEIRAGLTPGHLPKRYAATLDEDVRIGVSVRTSDRNPGVSITGAAQAKARKLRYLDAGRLTHPLFGDREHWYTQEEPSVRPGWFTGPAEAATPRVRAGIERALEDVSNRATRKGA
jgi:hypothetical protein